MTLIIDQIRTFKNPNEFCIQRQFNIDDVTEVLNKLKQAKREDEPFGLALTKLKVKRGITFVNSDDEEVRSENCYSDHSDESLSPDQSFTPHRHVTFSKRANTNPRRKESTHTHGSPGSSFKST